MKTRQLFFSLLICFLSYTHYSVAQSIMAITPNSSVPCHTIDIGIRGVNTHFKSGITTANFGEGVNVVKVLVANSITATITVNVTCAASLGFRNILLITGSEIAELDNGFEVFPASGAFRANIELLPMESVSLKDIDLSQPQKTPVLFFTNIYNDNTGRRVNIAIAVFAASKGQLGTMTLKNQDIAPNAIYKVTNRDFTAVNTNGPAGHDFLVTVELTGTFPPDDYTYKLTITDVNGTVLATDQSTMTITNPYTNPELIMPGAGFQADLPEEYNPLPMFQWFGQSDKYDLSIYELRPGQTQEDAVRNMPVYKQQDIIGTNYQYPNSAEKLIEGHTYAWQINGKANTARGIRYLPSEVFRFQYSSPTNNSKRIVSSIKINPEEGTLYAGQKLQFTAFCYDADGIIIEDAVPTWQVSPNLATIDRNGMFIAGQGGKTLAVIVSAGTATEFATVNVKINIIGSSKIKLDDYMKKLFGLQ